LRPFSPNISKDSFGGFVENQKLARQKRKFRFPPSFFASLSSKARAGEPRWRRTLLEE
jgi:hypothetical protein